jgi:hypothetical protein
MKHILSAMLLFAACALAQTAVCATQTSAAATTGLSSTKERGVVSIVTEPALSDGRLILKVVAFNRKREPASFSDANVKVFTAAGKPVALIPLEQLIGEAKQAGAPSRQAGNEHDPSYYSHPGIATNGVGGAGEPDVGGYSGANNPTSGVVSSHTPTSTTRRGQPADPQLAGRIASLQAGILQPLTIAPASAAGGQVVTEKLKFARKEARALRVVVDFNDEQHEFEFEAPPKARGAE